jgi:hypothetical protein
LLVLATRPAGGGAGRARRQSRKSVDVGVPSRGEGGGRCATSKRGVGQFVGMQPRLNPKLSPQAASWKAPLRPKRLWRPAGCQREGSSCNRCLARGVGCGTQSHDLGVVAMSGAPVTERAPCAANEQKSTQSRQHDCKKAVSHSVVRTGGSNQRRASLDEQAHCRIHHKPE